MTHTLFSTFCPNILPRYTRVTRVELVFQWILFRVTRVTRVTNVIKKYYFFLMYCNACNACNAAWFCLGEHYFPCNAYVTRNYKHHFTCVDMYQKLHKKYLCNSNRKTFFLYLRICTHSTTHSDSNCGMWMKYNVPCLVTHWKRQLTVPRQSSTKILGQMTFHSIFNKSYPSTPPGPPNQCWNGSILYCSMRIHLSLRLPHKKVYYLIITTLIGGGGGDLRLKIRNPNIFC